MILVTIPKRAACSNCRLFLSHSVGGVVTNLFIYISSVSQRGSEAKAPGPFQAEGEEGHPHPSLHGRRSCGRQGGGLRVHGAPGGGREDGGGVKGGPRGTPEVR